VVYVHTTRFNRKEALILFTGCVFLSFSPFNAPKHQLFPYDGGAVLSVK
jgi:hypothetical protein